MKELARHLVRSRTPVKRPGARKLADAAENVTEEGKFVRPESESVPHHSVYRTLDSWETRFRPPEDRTHLEPEALESPEVGQSERKVASRELEAVEVPEIHRGKRMDPRKKRRSALSVCVSDEEAELLRRYAASKGMGFSEWARGLMFRAMGRKPPARPRKE